MNKLKMLDISNQNVNPGILNIQKHKRKRFQNQKRTLDSNVELPLL